MSFTNRSAGALGFARLDLIFVPYSHYDETKTLLYPINSICLMNPVAGQVEGAVMNKTTNKFSPEVRGRAVRGVQMSWGLVDSTVRMASGDAKSKLLWPHTP